MRSVSVSHQVLELVHTSDVTVDRTAGSERSFGLDIARVLAAIAVLISHVAFVTGVVNPERWDSWLRLILPRLDVGVPVFFVLSGLLVGRPFVRSLVRNTDAPDLATFTLRRFARIFPLYWVVLAATLAFGAGAAPSPQRLVATMALVHIYVPGWAIGPITQSWTLATEISFYAFMPLWAWWMRRRMVSVTDQLQRSRWIGRSLAGWALIALVFRLAVIAGTNVYDYEDPSAVDLRGALLTWLPNHLDVFAAGVWFAVLLERRRLGETVLVKRVEDRPWVASIPARLWCYFGATLALLIASTGLDLPPLHTGFDGRQTVLRHGLFAVAATLAVAPSALQGPSRRWGALDVRLASWVRVGALGTYGVYLWHQVVTEWWFDWRDLADFNAPFPTALFVVVAVSAALAALTYHAVERWSLPALSKVLTAPVLSSPVGSSSSGASSTGASSADGSATAPRPRLLGATPALDGLRGLAIAAVLGTHYIFAVPGAEHRFLRGGFLGVDVFLVLSGFLISATLLRERDRTGTVRLGAFLTRRARRLLPPLVLFFLVHATVTAVIGDSLREEAIQAATALTFISNWQLSFGHHPPFDLVHLWSLAVEGQLYVLCGVAVAIAHRWLDRTREVLLALGAAAAAVMAWRYLSFRMGHDLEALYERTDVRADSMVIGAMAAVAWRARLVPKRVASTCGLIGGVFLLGAWMWTSAGSAWLFAGGFTLVAAASAAVALDVVDADGSVIGAIAGWAPLRSLGRISYSLYLWHLPIFVWFARGLPDMHGPLRYAVAVVVSVAVASISYALVERRVVSARRDAAAVESAGVGSGGVSGNADRDGRMAIDGDRRVGDRLGSGE